MSYLRYDKHRGPLPSEEQPDEANLNVMGVVKVLHGAEATLYELFMDPEQRVWARPKLSVVEHE